MIKFLRGYETKVQWNFSSKQVMGKKKHKKAQVTVKQAKVQVDNTKQIAEQVETQVEEEMLMVQEAEQEVPVAESLQGPEEQTNKSVQESEGSEEEHEDANAETEEVTQEQSEEPSVVQIKEWHESESATGSAEDAAEKDEAVEKKTKILMWAGIVMLAVVVIAGIAIGIAGKDKESVPASNGNVATPTLEAESELTSVPTETPTATPTAEPAEEPTAISTPTPTAEPTKELTGTPTATPTPEPTKSPTATPTPEPTKAPTVTPTPIVVADIDVSKYNIYSSKAEGWGIGKNTEHKQPTAWGYDDKYKFDEVGAWYVDKNATEDDKVIYLTFNCGYEVGYTEGFLEVLKKHDVKASWFVLEEYIRQCPEEIRWLMENGHLVGSHSAYHLNYGTSSPEAVIKDMLKNEQRMRDYVGLEMDKIMRPPSGYYNEQTLRIMQDLGYKTYFWSLAYPDWDPNDQPSEEYILNYFKANHHNGAIAVIHITSGKGMKVLDEVITMLKAEGYRFGLVTEIE